LVMHTGFDFVATQNQTTFSGTDASAHTLAYEPTEGVLVHVNGYQLRPVEDYTATDGTSIELTLPAQAGDWVSVVPLAQPSIGQAVSGIGDVPGLQDALDDRFSPSHLPSIAQVTGLSQALDAKYGADNLPPDTRGSISNGTAHGNSAWVFTSSARVNVTRGGWFRVTLIGGGGGGAGGGLSVPQTKLGGGCGGGGGAARTEIINIPSGSHAVWIGVGGRGGAGRRGVADPGRSPGAAEQRGTDGSATVLLIGQVTYRVEAGKGASVGQGALPGIGGTSVGARPGGYGGYADHRTGGGGGASGGSDAHDKSDADEAGYAARMLGGDGYGGGGIGAALVPLQQSKQPDGGAGADATRSLSIVTFGNFGGGGGGGAPTETPNVEAGDGGNGAGGVAIFEAL
jgi:hypothetical protein